MSRQGHGFDGWRPRFPEGLPNIDPVPSLVSHSFTAGSAFGGLPEGETSMGGWEGESEGSVTLRVPSPPRSSYRHYLISLGPVSGSPGFRGK